MARANVVRINGDKWFEITCDFPYLWGHICNSVMEEINCDYADIDMTESDRGDLLTVKGEVVGVMS